MLTFLFMETITHGGRNQKLTKPHTIKQQLPELGFIRTK